MNVYKILNELRSEHTQITEAIQSLERLVGSRGKRRGRPPKWMQESPKQKKRGPGRPRKRPAQEDD